MLDARDIVCQRVCVGDRRHLADVDANHRLASSARLHSCSRCCCTVVTGADPVDKCVVADEAEHTRFAIARLRTGRYRPDLDETEP
jgi:hypothetical protein